MSKICKNCQVEKELLDFYLKNGKPNSQCKCCLREKQAKRRSNRSDNDIKKDQIYFKEYRDKNKEKLKEYDKLNYLENKEFVKEKYKSYYEENREEINKKNSIRQKNNREKRNSYLREYNQNKRDNEPLYRLKNNLRTNIWSSIKRCGYKKYSKTYEILCCSFEEFKLHLESKFEDWMNLENYGKYNGELNYGWDIDHIIPVSSANSEEEIIKLNHYTNLQPLCSKINRDIKKDKLI